MDNNIILMILPPHSSHLTQPLDVGVFGALKKVMAATLEPLLRTGVSRIQKVEWLSAFVEAHDAVFKPRNIFSGFRGTGIFPFEPEKVLRRVSSPVPPAPQVDPSTPPPATTPFNSNVLTSSPIDINAVRAANVTFNELVDTGNPLPSDARQYAKYLTRVSERSHASKTILRRELEDRNQVLTARKARLSGKRQVTRGKHVLTTLEILKDVKDAEQATKKRKVGAAKKAESRDSKAMGESSSDSEESTTHREIEIIDCIEVQRS
jgi:hypothetical protein